MHNMGKTIGELHALLIEYEKGLPKKAATPQVMAIQGGRIQKANKKSQNAKGKGKGKGNGKDKSYIPKPKNPKPNAKEHPAKNDACHHCKEGLRGARKLKQGELYLYVGNGVRVQVEAIGSFDLVLPNGLSHNVLGIAPVAIIDRQLPFEYTIASRSTDVMVVATPHVMAIQGGRIQKANKKSLNAKGKVHTTKNDTCHHCKEVGHWKRNCHVYLAELIKKKKKVGIFSSSDGLRGARKLKQGDLYLYVGNGVRAQVEAIGSFDLVLPNGEVFKNEVENQLGKTIKAIRSDRGGEYISQEFKDYLKACGIVQQLTSPYTPQRNGVFERRNRTLLDMVRSMMNLKTLPLSFWDYALESAARILNMVPTKKVDKTPYELWYGKVPNLSYLKVWGCEALVKRDTPDKLQQRSVKCIFIGYPKEMMGYYFYFPPENKIVVARYAEFLEKNILSQEVSGRARELEEIQDEDTSPSEITSEIPMEVEGFEPPHEEEAPVRRSVRTHRAPERLCLNVEVEEHSLGDLNEPANYKAAMLDQESNKWLDAMNAEMQSMKDNQVWRLVDLPPDGKTVGSKWLFKKKTDMDGNVHTYKARLVAKGFTQTYRVDYEETFSPVADIRAIRILIAIAAFYDYEIWQMDVKTAFLNGYLDEDIYMV
ncbi:retrovirus-related pol polyprotein from transposon TNT 1-94 [Tanacetum coccineum]|uniref:Retrovirus-related pol polyprotein from transposon TNT 1-94 n=1 Tax=Tanacetum coccineum TaxID=301880 RepID=A0ABQ5EPE4_9ASTR